MLGLTQLLTYTAKGVFTWDRDELRPAWVCIDPQSCLFMCLHETGLTLSRLLDRDEKFLYRSEFVPFSYKWQQISDRVQKFQACMILGQWYLFSGIYLTKHVSLSRNQAPSISSWFHVNGCKYFRPVWVHIGLSSSLSHVNTLKVCCTAHLPFSKTTSTHPSTEQVTIFQ